MSIPTIPRDTRRRLFVRNIERKPTTATFRNQTTQVRIEEPSMRRRMQIAGYSQEVADRECMIALDTGSRKPAPRDADDDISVPLADSSETYRIIDVQDDIGSDCYILTLTRRNQ